MKIQSLFFSFYIFFLVLRNISSITRDLKYLEEKCILNDFYSKSNIIITFNATEGDFKEQEIKGPRFIINIYNKKSNKFKLKQSLETKKTFGKFSYNAKKTGHYKICIIAKDKSMFEKKDFIIYDLNIETSIEVKQKVSETANFKQFDKVNTKMEFIKDKVEQVENMQLMSNSLENSFSKTQINISTRIVVISIIQIVIIFSVGIYHVYALKKMFKDKISMPF
jgi:hypothetical protein